MSKCKLAQRTLGPAAAQQKGVVSVLGALPVVASVIAAKTGIDISVSGTQAYNTGGKKIGIPAIDPTDPYFRALAYGYTEHEAFHGRFTDFEVYGRAAGGSPIRRKLMNIIEDPVIECRGSREFPGAKADLHEVVRQLVSDGTFSAPAADGHPAEVLCAYVLYKLRHDLAGQTALADVLRQTEDVVRNVFSVGVCVRLAVLLQQAGECTTTQDCLDLADDIIAMLKDEEEKAKEPEPPRSQQDSDGGSSQDQKQQQDQGASQPGSQSEGDGQGHGAQGDQATPQSPQLGASGAQNGDSSRQGDTSQPGNPAGAREGGGLQVGQAEQPGKSATGHPPAGSGAGGADPSRQDKGSVIAQALSAGANDLPEDTFAIVGERLSKAAQTGAVERIPNLPSIFQADSNPVLGAERLRKVRATSAKLRARMQGLVQAYQHVPTRLARSGSQIDASRLALVPMGEDKVFEQRDEVDAPNTVFHLLVDTSDSMKGREQGARVVPVSVGGGTAARLPAPVDVACEAALALAVALEGIPNVSVAVTGFPGVRTVLKRGESVKKAAGRFTLRASGGTPMAEAIWHAVVDVAKAPEERKVIMVITDGEPSNRPTTEHVIRRCTGAGVEVIGIGINTPAVKGLFPVAAVIKDVSDLRNVIFELARKALMPRAA